MKLIVGLGNPEDKYVNTFHNLGFECADKLAQLFDVQFNKTKCRALIAETRCGQEKIIIAKPLTYMNLSGESVKELMSFYKIEPSSLMVSYDDFDLKKGCIRVREKGSAGTHNGMRNIISQIGTSDFARVRVGFKPETEQNIPLINLVLSGINKEDRQIFDKAVETSAKAMYDFCRGEDIFKIIQKYSGTTKK